MCLICNQKVAVAKFDPPDSAECQMCVQQIRTAVKMSKETLDEDVAATRWHRWLVRQEPCPVHFFPAEHHKLLIHFPEVWQWQGMSLAGKQAAANLHAECTRHRQTGEPEVRPPEPREGLWSYYRRMTCYQEHV